jgi:hypothetical protein
MFNVDFCVLLALNIGKMLAKWPRNTVREMLGPTGIQTMVTKDKGGGGKWGRIGVYYNNEPNPLKGPVFARTANCTLQEFNWSEVKCCVE